MKNMLPCFGYFLWGTWLARRLVSFVIVLILAGGFAGIDASRASLHACQEVHVAVQMSDGQIVAVPQAKHDRAVAGWKEYVWLAESGLRLQATLETGMAVSMLRVERATLMGQDGHFRIRFPIKNAKGEQVIVEEPILRFDKLKVPGSKKKKSMPVIRIQVCLAKQTADVDFLLWNRPGMNTRIVLGRDFLAKRFLIDPNRSFIAKAPCDRIIKS